ncbi:uncharacterized protein [Malus domestica]|uniref:uncharacterized protein n=1 Tax=Malus domestica TaxID=3750 RepID=UPI003975A3E8
MLLDLEFAGKMVPVEGVLKKQLFHGGFLAFNCTEGTKSRIRAPVIQLMPTRKNDESEYMKYFVSKHSVVMLARADVPPPLPANLDVVMLARVDISLPIVCAVRRRRIYTITVKLMCYWSQERMRSLFQRMS